NRGRPQRSWSACTSCAARTISPPVSNLGLSSPGCRRVTLGNCGAITRNGGGGRSGSSHGRDGSIDRRVSDMRELRPLVVIVACLAFGLGAPSGAREAAASGPRDGLWEVHGRMISGTRCADWLVRLTVA